MQTFSEAFFQAFTFIMIQLSIMERLKEVQIEPTIKDRFNKWLAKYLVTPDNIGYAVAPIVEYIHEEEPDYILAMDRGARIVGLATALLHHELYGTLPTKDKKIHFRKISVNSDAEIVRKQVGEDVDRMLEETESPKLLLLDDWIHGGETKKMITDVITDVSGGQVEIKYGVLIGDDTGKGFGTKGIGEGADVWGVANNFGYYSWRNNTNVTGVEYDNHLQVRNTLAPEATIFRRRVARSIKRYAQQNNG